MITHLHTNSHSYLLFTQQIEEIVVERTDLYMNTTDPRAIRTRQAIIEAFNELIATKEFNSISIKDITEKATINRATFYAHYLDKYDLLDQVLSTTIRAAMQQHFTCHNTLNEQTIAAMIESIVTVHDSMHTECRRGYNTFHKMVQEKTIVMLEQVLVGLSNEPVKSAMLAWAIYGAYAYWDAHPKEAISQYAKNAAPSLLQLL